MVEGVCREGDLGNSWAKIKHAWGGFGEACSTSTRSSAYSSKRNKLTKLRRCASRVSFGSKKWAQKTPCRPILLLSFCCWPPCRPQCPPPCQPSQCRLDALWGLRDADRMEIQKCYGLTYRLTWVGDRDAFASKNFETGNCVHWVHSEYTLLGCFFN